MWFRISLALIVAGIVAARAADATSPIDPAQRNAPFAPSPGMTPERQMPASSVNSSLQERRVEPAVVDRKESPLGGRRAPVDVGETREKNVLNQDVRPAEPVQLPMSRMDHQPSARSTQQDTKRPPTVAKYQDSLDAASASNMARFPALSGATAAKINRFIFRKNGEESGRALGDATAVPAAGGGAGVR